MFRLTVFVFRIKALDVMKLTHPLRKSIFRGNDVLEINTKVIEGISVHFFGNFVLLRDVPMPFVLIFDYFQFV